MQAARLPSHTTVTPSQASQLPQTMRHHKRRSGNWIVNDHAAQTINALNQFSSDNLLRRSLSNNFPFPQCNQMAGVTTGLIKIVQHRRQVNDCAAAGHGALDQGRIGDVAFNEFDLGVIQRQVLRLPVDRSSRIRTA